jgi:hypothetical protein
MGRKIAFAAIAGCFLFVSAFTIVADVTLTTGTFTWQTCQLTMRPDWSLESFNTGSTVSRTYDCIYLENEYIKINIVPGLGGRVISLLYKPTGHEEFYRVSRGIPDGHNLGNFYYDWLMAVGGVSPTFPEAEHGKYWLRPWAYQIIKQTKDTVSVKMTQKDTVNFAGHPTRFKYGRTDIECTYVISLISGKTWYQGDVELYNPGSTLKPYEYWTCTTLAPGSKPDSARATAGAEIISPVKNFRVADWCRGLASGEQSLGNDIYVFNRLRWYKNWGMSGIIYGWPDAGSNLGTFWGTLNHDNNEGILRVSNNNGDKSIGLKIWCWQYSSSVNSTTAPQLPYVEPWAGVSRMFFSPDTLQAGARKSFTEHFTPTCGMTAYTHANENVIVNLATDKAQYDGATDQNVSVTCQVFLTMPAVAAHAAFTFQGAGPAVNRVKDVDITPDAKNGNSITFTCPVKSIYSQTKELGLRITDAAGREYINAVVPVTVVNGTHVYQNDLVMNSGSAGNRFAGKLYSPDGKLVKLVFAGDDMAKLRLRQGIYLLKQESAHPVRTVVKTGK